MTRRSRSWTGVTLLILLVFNYFLFGFSLAKKRIAIRKNAESILIRQVKDGTVLKDSDESYVLDILKKEKIAIDKKIRILDAVTVSCIIVVISWTAFGLISGKKTGKG